MSPDQNAAWTGSLDDVRYAGALRLSMLTATPVTETEVRAWRQQWSDTATWTDAGIAARAITATDVVAVKLGEFIAWYSDGEHAFTTRLRANAGIDRVFDGWQRGRMPRKRHVENALVDELAARIERDAGATG